MDGAPPHCWAGSRTSCLRSVVGSRASTVDTSDAPPRPAAIKDGDARGVVSSLARAGKRESVDDDDDDDDDDGDSDSDAVSDRQERERVLEPDRLRSIVQTHRAWAQETMSDVAMQTVFASPPPSSPPLQRLRHQHPPQRSNPRLDGTLAILLQHPAVPRTPSDSSPGSSLPAGSPRDTGAGAAPASGRRPPSTPPSPRHTRLPSSCSSASSPYSIGSNGRAEMPRSPGALGHTALVSPMRKLVPPVPSTADGRFGRARSSKSPPEFYSWENLPPQKLVAACISAFYNCGFARLLCPVPETEATEVFRDIYSIGTAGRGSTSAPSPSPSLPGAASGRNGIRSTSNNFRLCQMLLLAAVGSQYLEETVTDDAHSALFSSGKWYLSVAFGRGANDLQRLRANLLAAMYLIFRKSISVIEHLNCAIAIGKARGLHHRRSPRQQLESCVGGLAQIAAGPSSRNVMEAPADELEDNWPAWKRTWRSLTFLDGWMSASVGSVSQVQTPFEPITEDVGRPQQHHHHHHHHHHHPPPLFLGPASCGSGDNINDSGGSSSSTGTGKPASGQDFDVHRQLEELGVLMAAITSDVVSPTAVPLNTVRVYSDRLKAWHANLPSSLTLSTAVRESQAAESPRSHSTLLIHCAYLGSIVQLTRRVLVGRVTSQLTGAPDVERADLGGGPGGHRALAEAHATADEFSKICVSAARQLATVVGMLRAENKLNRRCWLVIQSAYNAGLVICLDVSRSRGRPMFESAFVESLELIAKCIATVQHCAPFDAVASGFLAVLRPMFNTLRTPEPTGAAKRARMFRDPSAAYDDPAVAGTYPSNEALLGHILHLLKTPYGGEATTLDQDFFVVPDRVATFPEHYRFMDEPQQHGHGSQPAQHHQQHQQQHGHAQHQHPQQYQQHHQQQQQQYAQIHVQPSPNSALRSTGESTSPRQPGKGGHPWTKEEYEAYFRRVV